MYDPSMRVLTVLELLQARESVTGPELARRLEVSPRTVQRYITRLQDLGVPVRSSRGVGGAYHLQPGFRLPPLMFTHHEALALSLGLRALRALGMGAFAPASEGAAAKLERALPAEVRERLYDVEEAMQLDVSPWTVETDTEAVAHTLAAVRRRRVVAFAYCSGAGEHTRRQVEPYGVVHLDGRWYLVGRCRQREALRSFRLDRVAQLQTLDAAFERPQAFDARAYLRETLPFAYAAHDIEVWLELPPETAAARLTPWRVTLAPEAGGTSLRCSREHLESFAAMLLGLGCPLTVRRPDALREAFATLSGRAAQAAGAHLDVS